jgi:hypothetical protein
LICELQGFTDTDALTAWAQRFLALKNQLTTSDAQQVEPEAQVGGDGEPTAAKGHAVFDREPGPTPEKPKPGRKLNGSRVPRRAATSENGSVEAVPSETAQQLVTPLSKELQLRDRDHLKFVSTQPVWLAGAARRTRTILNSLNSGRSGAK